jgi:hypothetical protein
LYPRLHHDHLELLRGNVRLGFVENDVMNHAQPFF